MLMSHPLPPDGLMLPAATVSQFTPLPPLPLSQSKLKCAAMALSSRR